MNKKYKIYFRFQKNDQSNMFGHVENKLAFTIVVDDDLSQNFNFNSRRSQRRLLNLINLLKVDVVDDSH